MRSEERFINETHVDRTNFSCKFCQPLKEEIGWLPLNRISLELNQKISGKRTFQPENSQLVKYYYFG